MVWVRLRRVLQLLVNHNYFKRAIFIAILFNTFSMGIEYHNQPDSLSHAVEISNVIFTGKHCGVSIQWRPLLSTRVNPFCPQPSFAVKWCSNY